MGKINISVLLLFNELWSGLRIHNDSKNSKLFSSKALAMWGLFVITLKESKEYVGGGRQISPRYLTHLLSVE